MSYSLLMLNGATLHAQDRSVAVNLSNLRCCGRLLFHTAPLWPLLKLERCQGRIPCDAGPRRTLRVSTEVSSTDYKQRETDSQPKKDSTHQTLWSLPREGPPSHWRTAPHRPHTCQQQLYISCAALLALWLAADQHRRWTLRAVC